MPAAEPSPFPNVFVFGNPPAVFTVDVPHMLDEQARHLAYILQYAFEHDITLVGVGGGQGDETQDSFRAVFIRAPWVEQTGPGVSILGTDLGTGRIVAVRQGQLLATAFHPELTPDRRIHQLFVDIVKDNT